MLFDLNFFDKYKGMLTSTRSGVYSDFDCTVLYAAVRESKPGIVVEFSPGRGRTTSCIAQALKDNGNDVQYFLFEMNEKLLNDAVQFLKQFPNITVVPGTNIINNPNLDLINDVDFLMVDSNHDSFLARYYMETLFPKVKEAGIIHIHDIYYNKNNRGWEDTGLGYFKSIPGQYMHPDLCSEDRLMELYGKDFFNKYYTGKIDHYEEDEVRDFILRNNIDFYSTKYAAQKLNIPDPAVRDVPSCCSIYFKYNKDYK